MDHAISFPQPEPDPIQHSFAQAPQADIERSTFSLSHAIKLTMDCSYLVPFYTDEMLPGETRTASFNFFGRLLTPLAAPMDNLYLDSFFFFIPNRLLWKNWVKFCGEQENPGDSTTYTVPKIAFNTPGAHTFGVHSLGDYFGHPCEVALDSDEINSWQWRGYALCVNKWFRDENLQQEVMFNDGDGPDYLFGPSKNLNDTLIRRGRRKDYFTSALPWPQKGSAVLLPLGTTAPVNITQITSTNVGTSNIYASSASGGGGVNAFIQANNGSGLVFPPEIAALIGQADLSTATAANINDIRLAFQLQKLLERDARGGTRYPEFLRAHFGVVDPMLAVLQYPQYLGGGRLRSLRFPSLRWPPLRRAPTGSAPSVPIKSFRLVAATDSLTPPPSTAS